MGKIYKAFIMDGDAEVSVIQSTDIVNEAIRLHNLSPLCAAGLGRALTATAFMSTNLKNEGDRLSVTINGNGAGGRIITSADSALRVRGRIDRPDVDLPLKPDGKLDVGGLVGKRGNMTVVRSMGLKEPYVGRSNLISGEIAEDFAAYYAYSEQQPTAIALGVLVGKEGTCIGAGGVVMQPMPGCSDEKISMLEKTIGEFGDISAKIRDLGAEGVCKKYFPNAEFTEFEPKYECNCSKEYIDGVLVTIGKEELEKTLSDLGKVEVCCEFCDKKYVYFKDDIEKLF